MLIDVEPGPVLIPVVSCHPADIIIVAGLLDGSQSGWEGVGGGWGSGSGFSHTQIHTCKQRDSHTGRMPKYNLTPPPSRLITGDVTMGTCGLAGTTKTVFATGGTFGLVGPGKKSRCHYGDFWPCGDQLKQFLLLWGLLALWGPGKTVLLLWGLLTRRAFFVCYIDPTGHQYNLSGQSCSSSVAPLNKTKSTIHADSE